MTGGVTCFYFKNWDELTEISIFDVVERWLLNNKFCFDINDLNNLSCIELSEIFINVYVNYDDIFEYFYDDVNNEYGLYLNKIEKNKIFMLSNKVNAFVKYKKLSINKDDNIRYLVFNECEIVNLMKNESLSNDAKTFLKLKNKIDIESINEKEKILSNFKSKYDFYFKDRIEIDGGKFIKFNNDSFKTYWQSLSSHLGSTNTSNKKGDILKEQYNKMSLEEKNDVLNEIFDAVLFAIYKLDQY